VVEVGYTGPRSGARKCQARNEYDQSHLGTMTLVHREFDRERPARSQGRAGEDRESNVTATPPRRQTASMRVLLQSARVGYQ